MSKPPFAPAPPTFKETLKAHTLEISQAALAIRQINEHLIGEDAPANGLDGDACVAVVYMLKAISVRLDSFADDLYVAYDAEEARQEAANA